jgi:hypothetical protein
MFATTFTIARDLVRVRVLELLHQSLDDVLRVLVLESSRPSKHLAGLGAEADLLDALGGLPPKLCIAAAKVEWNSPLLPTKRSLTRTPRWSFSE